MATLYPRPALSTRDRELATVVALVALGRSSQIPQHLRASLKAGLTPDELREAILQTATIAGFPVAMNAMSTLKNVLAESERSDLTTSQPPGQPYTFADHVSPSPARSSRATICRSRTTR